MSARYLWDTYNVVSVDVEGEAQWTTSVGFTYNLSHTYWGAVSKSYTFRDGRFRFDDAYILLPSSRYAIDAKEYPYLMFLPTEASANAPVSNSLLYNSHFLNSADEMSWYKAFRNSASGYGIYDIALLKTIDVGKDDWNNRSKLFSYIPLATENVQGPQSKGRISSNNSSAYPRDGADSKAVTWYKYIGSDNIDPSGITYTKSELQAGEPVGISVNPRQPVYGGTVYYQFSYSIDGGRTWTNIGSKTTALGVSVTIPAGAQQFQAKAIVSDGWGFTSATSIYGPSLGVSVLNGYIGVSNKARKATKLYVGVGNMSREVIRGYIGVDGKAKKFL